MPCKRITPCSYPILPLRFHPPGASLPHADRCTDHSGCNHLLGRRRRVRDLEAECRPVHLRGRTQPKSLTLRIEPHAKGEVFTLDRTEANGRTTSSSILLYFDGTARAFQDAGCSGTQSSRRLDSRTVEILRDLRERSVDPVYPAIGFAAKRNNPGDYRAIHGRTPFRAPPGIGETVRGEEI